MKNRDSGIRIVVTGASGFIGGFLVNTLKAGDGEVLGVARSGTSTVRVGSYAETPAGDVLVHLAENNDRAAALSAGASYETETVQTLKVLAARGFQKIIYASTSIVYGNTSPVPYGVDSPTVATDPYTRAKLTCEACVLDAGGVVARLSNVYGPGMSSNNVVSTILGQIPGTGPLQIRDDKPVCDFIWVEDVALALAAMVNLNCSGIYNVGTGVGTGVGDLAGLALALVGEAGRGIVATKPSGKLSCNTLDISETVDQLGWLPQTMLEKGMRLLLSKKKMGRKEA